MRILLLFYISTFFFFSFAGTVKGRIISIYTREGISSVRYSVYENQSDAESKTGKTIVNGRTKEGGHFEFELNEQKDGQEYFFRYELTNYRKSPSIEPIDPASAEQYVFIMAEPNPSHSQLVQAVDRIKDRIENGKSTLETETELVKKFGLQMNQEFLEIVKENFSEFSSNLSMSSGEQVIEDRFDIDVTRELDEVEQINRNLDQRDEGPHPLLPPPN